jgi:hypothetical protein
MSRQVAVHSLLAPLTGRQNTYLISLSVTNKLKERFYHEYVPELLDVRRCPSIHVSRPPC